MHDKFGNVISFLIGVIVTAVGVLVSAISAAVAVVSVAMECLFNPTQLTAKLQVNWNRLVVPGLSHQVLQFQSTSNTQLSGVEFYLDRFFAATTGSDSVLGEFRAFLRALTVPVAGTETVAATAPPRVLVIWPEVITVECVVNGVEFQYRQFDVEGRVLVYTATVGFEAILDVRVTSEEVRASVR